MKKNRINEFNILGVNIQFIITILLVIFLIISLFINKLFIVVYFLISIDLFIMAYNNKRIYKKGKMTIVYIICAIIVFIYAILKIIGVV